MEKNLVINIILLVGVSLGVILASVSLIKETNLESQGDWIAKIDEVEISKAKYLLHLESLATDKRNPLSREDKLYVLERIIEEELLIQRAKDLGILSTNNMVRGTIVQQMINSIVTDNSLVQIKDEELKIFFDENKGFFSSANKLRVRQIYFSDTDKENSLQNANEAFYILMDGNSFEEAAKLGSSSALEIPDTLMTLSKVREYIGPSLMAVAQRLQPGQFTRPKKVKGGYKIIFLVDREDAIPPKFNEIKGQVKSEFIKRRDDNSLREYLENLKDWYDIKRNFPD